MSVPSYWSDSLDGLPMTIAHSAYDPPLWLRSAHLQSLVSTSPMRRARGEIGRAHV